jgi:hypothetical protein
LLRYKYLFGAASVALPNNCRPSTTRSFSSTASSVPTSTVPEQPLPASSAANQAAQNSGIIGGAIGGLSIAPGLATGLQFTLWQLQLIDCSLTVETPGTADSPLQWRIGSDSYSMGRGAVIGNIFLITIVAIALAAAVFAWHLVARIPVGDAADDLTFPGWVVVPFNLLLQPSLGYALNVGLYAGGGAFDIALCVTATTLLVAGYLCAVHITVFNRDAVAVTEEKLKCKGCESGSPDTGLLRTAIERFEAFSEGGVEWYPAPNTSDPHFAHRFRPVFEPYRPERRWFVAVDIGTAVVGGVMSAIKPPNDSGCTSLKWANVVFSALLPVSLLASPLNSPMLTFIYWLLYLGNLAAAVCILIDLHVVAKSIVIAQVYVLLSLIALSFVCKAIRRGMALTARGGVIAKLFCKARASTDAGRREGISSIAAIQLWREVSALAQRAELVVVMSRTHSANDMSSGSRQRSPGQDAQDEKLLQSVRELAKMRSASLQKLVGLIGALHSPELRGGRKGLLELCLREPPA